MMEDETFTVVSLSVLGCATIALLKNAACRKSPVDYIAFLHGVICTVISWYVIWQIPDTATYLVKGEDAVADVQRILPMITWGFSVYDIVDGVRTGDKSFILHGITLFALCAGMYYAGKLHMLTLPLVVETSTPFLHLVSFGSMAIKLTFLLSFLSVRWVYVPYIWCKYVFAMMSFESLRPHDWCVLLGGIPIHGLNAYWGVKLIKKAMVAFGYLEAPVCRTFAKTGECPKGEACDYMHKVKEDTKTSAKKDD